MVVGGGDVGDSGGAGGDVSILVVTGANGSMSDWFEEEDGCGEEDDFFMKT